MCGSNDLSSGMVAEGIFLTRLIAQESSYFLSSKARLSSNIVRRKKRLIDLDALGIQRKQYPNPATCGYILSHIPKQASGVALRE